MSFSPFALRLDNQTYQIMKASDENIADLLGLEQEVYFGRTPWSRFSFKSELKKACQFFVSCGLSGFNLGRLRRDENAGTRRTYY